jgi:hypothetical protein
LPTVQIQDGKRLQQFWIAKEEQCHRFTGGLIQLVTDSAGITESCDKKADDSYQHERAS